MMKRNKTLLVALSLISVATLAVTGCGPSQTTSATTTAGTTTMPTTSATETQATLEGMYTYDDFDQPAVCGACHQDIYREWQNSLMSQCFTHEWDDVEYFKLALPHALKLEKVSGVKSGCIACHAPLAYLSGDIPPASPSMGTRANEGVSCEICHAITGSTESVPFNFSYMMDVGDTKYGPRDDAVSPYHGSQYSAFTVSPEMCATCHDEQSPYGAWVKETYREWQSGPYAAQGVICQECHMDPEAGTSAVGGKARADVAHHTFLGAHFTEQLEGTVTISLAADHEQVSSGNTLTIAADLTNALSGHYFPTGSTEERMLWLEVWATDSSGARYHIPVVTKGFAGEEYTIADSSAIAYQDIGDIMDIASFAGLSRDGDVPDGARIFRRPFFNPEGEMTICQWYTENNEVVDYRFAPGQTRNESYVWVLPQGIAPGALKIEATLYYSLLPSSVGEFFELPETEYQPMVVSSQSLTLNVK